MHLTPPTSLDRAVIDARHPGPLGVAVSGGGDSLALLRLLIAEAGLSLQVATVDHAIRPESIGEAQEVGKICADLGLDHTILPWEGWDGTGNLQDQARRARKSLISNWARSRGIASVALGHTADDQAETFLIRLARGSGLDGLAAMEPVTTDHGIQWLRPLLHLRRTQLRDYLRGIGQQWTDDPSNDAPKFARVRMRKALDKLEPLGIDVPEIAQTTARLRSAKQVLFAATKDLAELAATLTPLGEIRLDTERVQSAQQSVRLRLVSEALRFVSGSYYAPRAFTVEELIAGFGEAFMGASLHGCLIRREGAHIHIRREPAHVEGPARPGALWDNRWLVTGPDDGADCTVSALGEAGLAQCPDWRETGHRRESLLTTPGVWRDATLISAPMAGYCRNWTSTFTPQSPFFTHA